MRHLLIAVTLLAGFSTVPSAAQVALQEVATGFSSPVFLTGRGNNLYVVQQGGGIVAVDRTTHAQTNFFTVPDLVTGGELGLLGLAFDPSYATNGRFYVNATASLGGQLVSEIRRYTNPAIATEAASVLLRVTQPFSNHKGGWLDFGPDNKLYIAFGDGGSGNDPQNNAQNLNSNLGKILRIDVSADAFPTDPARNYTIPADNPFGTEIFAYGLRNPFRDSFDRATGDLYIGDVGQGAIEEVDRISAGTSGQNFGWRPLEGNGPTPGVGDPIPAGTTAPLLTYDHSQGDVSIIGGYVYRGGQIVELNGKYVFGDFASGRLWSMDLDGSNRQLLLDTSFNLSSFGEDSSGNLYVVDLSGGRVLQFTGTAPSAGVPEPATWAMLLTGFGVVGARVRRRRAALASKAVSA